MAERNRRGLFNRLFGRNKKTIDNNIIGAEPDNVARFRADDATELYTLVKSSFNSLPSSVEKKNLSSGMFYDCVCGEPTIANEKLLSFLRSHNLTIDCDEFEECYFNVWQDYLREFYNSPDYVETRMPATSLPDGWHWVDYGDGSGSLRTPEDAPCFSYDMCTNYAFQGGIEYDTSDNSSSVFYGTLQEFKSHAEGLVNKQRLSVSLGEYNISAIMNELSYNVWYGREPQTARIVAGENVIEIKGYIYEPTYEYFSSTASLSLNGEELYGVDSRNVEAYRNEVYQTGKFADLTEAISYIKDKTPGQRYVLKDRESDSLENTINTAAAKSEQTDSKNVSLNRDILIK